MGLGVRERRELADEANLLREVLALVHRCPGRVPAARLDAVLLGRRRVPPLPRQRDRHRRR